MPSVSTRYSRTTPTLSASPSGRDTGRLREDGEPADLVRRLGVDGEREPGLLAAVQANSRRQLGGCRRTLIVAEAVRPQRSELLDVVTQLVGRDVGQERRREVFLELCV